MGKSKAPPGYFSSMVDKLLEVDPRLFTEIDEFHFGAHVNSHNILYAKDLGSRLERVIGNEYSYAPSTLLRNTKNAMAARKKVQRKQYSNGEVLRALTESVKLQSHYAEILNNYDGGNRMIFRTPQEFMMRLRQLADIKAREEAWGINPAAISIEVQK